MVDGPIREGQGEVGKDIIYSSKISFFFFVEIWCMLLSHHNNVIESLANQH